MKFSYFKKLRNKENLNVGRVAISKWKTGKDYPDIQNIHIRVFLLPLYL